MLAVAAVLAAVALLAQLLRHCLRPRDPPPRPADGALDAWAKLVRGALRLKRVRRLWHVLGVWLQEIKERGRLAYLPDEPAAAPPAREARWRRRA